MNITSIKQHSIKTFHAYTDSATFHCIKYTGMLSLNIFERIFWSMAFSLFFALCCTVGFYLWEKYDEKPTIVKIEDTHLAFTSVAFPAVTICPANRIKPSLAFAYLSRYLNDTIANKVNIMTHIISALSLLQHPTYIHMEYHLKKSLPTCAEIMKQCYWHGKKEDCCSIFSLQRTEEGFCYSFNSLLSEANHECPVYIPAVMVHGDYKSAHHDRRCSPRHTTSSGVFSGLTVILKKDDSNDRIGPNGTKYERGVVLMITTSHELPEAGTGATLETLPGEMLQMEVRPVVFGSSRKLINVAQKDRRCNLHNEKRLWIYNLYTQSTCLTECRLKYVEIICKCQLYFFYDKSSLHPPCTVKQLSCVAKLKFSLRTKDLSKLDLASCKCILPCYGILYDKTIKRSNLTILNGSLEYGILDIHYSNKGGIKYSKNISFPEIQLLDHYDAFLSRSLKGLLDHVSIARLGADHKDILFKTFIYSLSRIEFYSELRFRPVSIGNVCNLFLGCSIISILEIIYYFLRTWFVCNLNKNRTMSRQQNKK